MRTGSRRSGIGTPQLLLAFFGVAWFVALGLLGMHLHSAVPVAHLQPVVAAGAIDASAAQTAPLGAVDPVASQASLGSPGPAAPGSFVTADASPAATDGLQLVGPAGAGADPAQGSVHLEAVTACMLALLITFVLMAVRAQRGRVTRGRSIPHRVASPPRARTVLEGARPLYLFLSISRT